MSCKYVFLHVHMLHGPNKTVCLGMKTGRAPTRSHTWLLRYVPEAIAQAGDSRTALTLRHLLVFHKGASFNTKLNERGLVPFEILHISVNSQIRIKHLLSGRGPSSLRQVIVTDTPQPVS